MLQGMLHLYFFPTWVLGGFSSKLDCWSLASFWACVWYHMCNGKALWMGLMVRQRVSHPVLRECWSISVVSFLPVRWFRFSKSVESKSLSMKIKSLSNMVEVRVRLFRIAALLWFSCWLKIKISVKETEKPVLVFLGFCCCCWILVEFIQVSNMVILSA